VTAWGPDSLLEADEVVRAACGDAFPGAVAGIGGDGFEHVQAFGRLSAEAGAPSVREDTIYDLASLTKVVVTTTLAMQLVDEGLLDLDAPVCSYVPGFVGGARARVAVRGLLAHAAGLPAWAALYGDASSRAGLVARVVAMELEYEPGTQCVYSDLGFILLGEALERAAGAPIDALARSRVLGPLGMRDTLYCPPPALLPRVAPTEHDPWRGRLLRGEVHDENAFAMGGVAAHAGLFGTAADLGRLARVLLAGGVFEGRRLVSRATLESFTRRVEIPGTTRALGWDTASDRVTPRSSVPGRPGYSSAGSRLSPRSFGHTGFTGTSLWIDPERGVYVILLSNRVHPSRANDRIRAVRARLADAVAVAWDRAGASAR
jgi:CubicO group peptidase (beta-lactamase class C family)